jgi:hypothetical protein
MEVKMMVGRGNGRRHGKMGGHAKKRQQEGEEWHQQHAASNTQQASGNANDCT